ncbi:MAG TPA: hypothetical protein EYQ48_00730 [Candidatus Lambdaproteobacteria bacterium]|nr:hypothetical protein [Candidatus Lambdaproteobacteria bacterium]
MQEFQSTITQFQKQ